MKTYGMQLKPGHGGKYLAVVNVYIKKEEIHQMNIIVFHPQTLKREN